jgi:hypothetical protein
MLINPKNRLDTYLIEITQQLKKQLTLKRPTEIYEITQHPGKTGSQTCYQKMNSYLQEKSAPSLCAGIYTLIANVINVKPVETEQADVTLQLSVYVLIVSNQAELEQRINLRFILLKDITKLINNNRWQLDYTFPASQLKRIDLYGLTFDPKQITGIKGWNPSIQAHAKDLYVVEENTKESVPANLSLSLLTWEQTLRIGETCFKQEVFNKISITSKLV